MSLLIVLYLLLILVLPLALSAGVSYRTLPEGRACPLCGGDSLRLVSRWLRLTSTLLRRTTLHRRWCPRCGWEGVVRIYEDRPVRRLLGLEPPLTAPAADPADVPRAADGAGQQTQTGDTLEVRKLDLNGEPWRVLLQFWSDDDLWCGRLLFLAPSGRLCPDPREPFHGSSPLDVLGQALALSDRILTCRLRELISD